MAELGQKADPDVDMQPCEIPCYSRTPTLLAQDVSLLIGVGNYAQNDFVAVVSNCLPNLRAPNIVSLPVKFPVSREFAWRQVRSALRRQPVDICSSNRLAELKLRSTAIKARSKSSRRDSARRICNAARPAICRAEARARFRKRGLRPSVRSLRDRRAP